MIQKRSPSRFLIVSGTYLFLMVLATTIQPVWGYKPNTDLTELRDLLFLPLWCCIAFMAIISGKIGQKQIGKEFIRSGTLFLMLILSVIGHFLLSAGDSIRITELMEYETALIVLKLTSAGISVILLCLACVFSNKKAGLFLLILEFIFWTLKALVYYNSSADLIFSGYLTVICCALRLILVMKLIVEKRPKPEPAA